MKSEEENKKLKISKVSIKRYSGNEAYDIHVERSDNGVDDCLNICGGNT